MVLYVWCCLCCTSENKREGEREQERKRERERASGWRGTFFFASIYSFLPEMQECKRLLFLTSTTRRRLQMNETVVSFNLVNTWRYGTFRESQSIDENKANPQTKGWNQGWQFCHFRGKILSFFSYHRAIYIKLYNPSNNKKGRWKERMEEES